VQVPYTVEERPETGLNNSKLGIWVPAKYPAGDLGATQGRANREPLATQGNDSAAAAESDLPAQTPQPTCSPP